MTGTTTSEAPAAAGGAGSRTREVFAAAFRVVLFGAPRSAVHAHRPAALDLGTPARSVPASRRASSRLGRP